MTEKSHSRPDCPPGPATWPEVIGHARASTGSAGEDKYRKLIFFVPTALWQVDSRAAGEIFQRLKAEGVTDIGPTTVYQGPA